MGEYFRCFWGSSGGVFLVSVVDQKKGKRSQLLEVIFHLVLFKVRFEKGPFYPVLFKVYFEKRSILSCAL